MRDQHQRATIFEQALFQNLERRNIEIVGRFVEQEDVGGLQHQAGNQDAGALAAGKVRHRLVELLAGEQETRSP